MNHTLEWLHHIIRTEEANIRQRLPGLLWSGSPRNRMFIIVTGPLLNKTRLMGPDAKFTGLDHLINTGNDECGSLTGGLSEHEYNRLVQGLFSKEDDA